MSDELFLFGDEPSENTSLERPVAAPVSGWQVDLLRKALDARGLSSVAERQQTIEILAGRPVGALRELTQEEALRILSEFGQEPGKRAPGGAVWDDREEDTWIDRL